MARDPEEGNETKSATLHNEGHGFRISDGPGEKSLHHTPWYLHKPQRAHTVHIDLEGRITAIISP